MIDKDDVASAPIGLIRAYAAAFRLLGNSYEGAGEAQDKMVKAALELAKLYEERTEHLDDVVQERMRYFTEAATLRRAIAARFQET